MVAANRHRVQGNSVMTTPSNSAAFAFKNSGLNTFLFAEVGTEMNGSELTILSTLARLGLDPWAQAAEWAAVPATIAMRSLAQSILKMPLSPRALAEAGATAARLVLLLPGKSGTPIPAADGTKAGIKIPEWVPMAVFAVVLGLAIIAGKLTAPPSPPVPAQVEQTPGNGS